MFHKLALVLGPAFFCVGGFVGWLLYLKVKKPEAGFGIVAAVGGGGGAVAALVLSALGVIVVPESAQISSRFVCPPGRKLIIDTIKRKKSTEYVGRCLTRDFRREDPVIPLWVFLLLVYALPFTGLATLVILEARGRALMKERDSGRGPFVRLPPELVPVRFVAGGMFAVGLAGVITLFVTTDFTAAKPGRPSSLGEKPGCTLWVGTAPGNDPSLLVEVRLCEKKRRGPRSRPVVVDQERLESSHPEGSMGPENQDLQVTRHRVRGPPCGPGVETLPGGRVDTHRKGRP